MWKRLHMLYWFFRKGMLLQWIIGWVQCSNFIVGIPLKGDEASPPTRWWNHWYLARWGWKTVTVLEVPEEATRIGYHVGYLPQRGKAMSKDKISHEPRFRIKNGHEDCTFFAISAADGKEVPLKVVDRTIKSDPTYKNAPLH